MLRFESADDGCADSWPSIPEVGVLVKFALLHEAIERALPHELPDLLEALEVLSASVSHPILTHRQSAPLDETLILSVLGSYGNLSCLLGDLFPKVVTTDP